MATETLEKTETKIKAPRQFKVVLYNDDKTPFDFVILMLVTHFNKSPDDATKITGDIHKNGHGIAGVYTKEIAEQKVLTVTAEAKANGFPLKVKAEPN